MKHTIIILLILALLSCKGEAPNKTKAVEEKQAAPQTMAPPAAAPPAGGVNKVSISGTVLEIIGVAGGTYLRLKTPTGEIWAAVDKTNVKKGTEVTVINAIPMDGFESKALKRKFEHLYFGNIAGGATPPAVHPASPDAPPQAQPPVDMKGTIAQQHAMIDNAPDAAGDIKVKKAEGAAGKTISEIFAAKASLKGATVAVRGKVVKFNPGIMGKNWLHLRDGSGSRPKKDDDITVTTMASAAVGDVVLVQGTVQLDRDFGSGYMYPVIIEDAQVSK